MSVFIREIIVLEEEEAREQSRAAFMVGTSCGMQLHRCGIECDDWILALDLA